jgi:hypothetical protein
MKNCPAEEYIWDIKIRRVGNGFIIKTIGEDGEIEEIYPAEHNYSLKGERKEELEKIADFLYTILEELGYYYSKHNKYNISINVKKNESYGD